MASRIKGITVEIGGDTSGLEKALSDVNNSIKKTQSQLRDVNNLLKLDPSNTVLLAQKQELLQSSIGDWIYRCAESACPVFWKSPVRKEEITVPDR